MGAREGHARRAVRARRRALVPPRRDRPGRGRAQHGDLQARVEAVLRPRRPGRPAAVAGGQGRRARAAHPRRRQLLGCAGRHRGARAPRARLRHPEGRRRAARAAEAAHLGGDPAGDRSLPDAHGAVLPLRRDAAAPARGRPARRQGAADRGHARRQRSRRRPPARDGGALRPQARGAGDHADRPRRRVHGLRARGCEPQADAGSSSCAAMPHAASRPAASRSGGWARRPPARARGR